MTDLRIGHGYDVHRLVEGRSLIIGGVNIPSPVGLLGHSDADVLTHAVMDAVVGALGLGDIGKHFPDTDPRFKGANSLVLAAHVFDLMADLGYCIGNIDATVIAQAPKLAPYIAQMRENLARTFCTDIERVNIKATTEEKLGFTGAKEGIASHAVCLLVKN
ncbi:MAG: 2-C-methyl-D-erythritol 2,4-cyclodiphosphate synthase [Clostridia bacterium]|nr:2-C-methyl-D-erythritol 2,4-cyclodiphosphate synthase [Clostridia bacterium]